MRHWVVCVLVMFLTCASSVALVSLLCVAIAVDHLNIIRLHDVYENASNLYIVMDVCGGGELFVRFKNPFCFFYVFQFSFLLFFSDFVSPFFSPLPKSVRRATAVWRAESGERVMGPRDARADCFLSCSPCLFCPPLTGSHQGAAGRQLQRERRGRRVAPDLRGTQVHARAQDCALRPQTRQLGRSISALDRGAGAGFMTHQRAGARTRVCTQSCTAVDMRR